MPTVSFSFQITKMRLFIKTISGKMTSMEIVPSDTFASIADKIFAEEGILPSKLLFSAEQQPDEDISTLSTPDLFESEELIDRNSDPIWTPGSTRGSQAVLGIIIGTIGAVCSTRIFREMCAQKKNLVCFNREMGQ
jgi:hypothetical protein